LDERALVERGVAEDAVADRDLDLAVRPDAGVTRHLDQDVTGGARIGPFREHRIGSSPGGRSVEGSRAMRKINDSIVILSSRTAA